METKTIKVKSVSESRRIPLNNRNYHTEVKCMECGDRWLWGLSWDGSRDSEFVCPPCLNERPRNACLVNSLRSYATIGFLLSILFLSYKSVQASSSWRCCPFNGLDRKKISESDSFQWSTHFSGFYVVRFSAMLRLSRRRIWISEKDIRKRLGCRL